MPTWLVRPACGGQVFGRELAVAQAWLRLAALEAQQDKVGSTVEEKRAERERET